MRRSNKYLLDLTWSKASLIVEWLRAFALQLQRETIGSRSSNALKYGNWRWRSVLTLRR